MVAPIDHLCGYCQHVVYDYPPSCPNCGGKFKSPKKAGILSFIFPGIGDWYLGRHRIAAMEIAGAAIAWMALIGRLLRSLTPTPAFVAACVVMFLTAHGLDAFYTWRAARKKLYLEVPEKLSVGASILRFATVVGVFVFATAGAIANDIVKTIRRGDAEEAARKEAVLGDPRVQEFRAAQAARVEHITVETLAERIATPTNEYAVVALYEAADEHGHSPHIFPELVALQRDFAGKGVDFKIFAIDQDATVPDIPPFLAIMQAPFAPVRVRPWQPGQLSANMTRLGIDIGTQWHAPLVALIDREGKVLWQQQGMDELSALRGTLRTRIPADMPMPQT